MGSVFKLLMVLFVGLGMQSRALGVDPCEAMVAACHHGHDHDHDHGHTEATDGCRSSDHDPAHCGADPVPADHSGEVHSEGDAHSCPHHHHHHGGCVCAGSHLMDARDGAIRLAVPGATLLRVAWLEERAPEGPFLSGEKPPLI